MKICWHWISQCADQQQLPCGALEQVCAADDLSDQHRGIVDNHGKLIGGNIVATPEKKVGEVASGDKLLMSEITIIKGNRFAVRDFESPAHSSGRIVVFRGSDSFAAGSGIGEFVVSAADWTAAAGDCDEGSSREVGPQIGAPGAPAAQNTLCEDAGEGACGPQWFVFCGSSCGADNARSKSLREQVQG